jgi:hypothetical protein
VRIFFRDEQLQRTCNDGTRLRAEFGPEIGTQIATRLAVMDVVDNLACVPRRQPIGLRHVAGSKGQFTVDLTEERKLSFLGLDGEESGPTDDPDSIVEIEVIGVI